MINSLCVPCLVGKLSRKLVLSYPEFYRRTASAHEEHTGYGEWKELKVALPDRRYFEMLICRCDAFSHEEERINYSTSTDQLPAA